MIPEVDIKYGITMAMSYDLISQSVRQTRRYKPKTILQCSTVPRFSGGNQYPSILWSNWAHMRSSGQKRRSSRQDTIENSSTAAGFLSFFLSLSLINVIAKGAMQY